MASDVTPPALAVRGLRKSFGRHVVLAGIDLEVTAGTVTAVLGPSGGGKTTLLRIVAGFDTPDAGAVDIAGVHVAGVDPGGARANVPPERRRVGVVPQEGALFPHLDVAGNVGFGLPRGPARAERIAATLELVGLPGIERMRPHELSGGQQHRVALARALAPRPSLVVLDEPFSSLDAGLRAQVREDVLRALHAAQATAIVVTHDQQEALSVADRVAVLLDGRIAQHADPVEVYEAPRSIEVATFVGEAVVLDGTAGGDTVDCALGRLRLRDGAPITGPVQVIVRPEQVELSNRSADTTSGVAGKVLSRAFFGHDGTVRVELGDGTILRARLHASSLPAPGAEITARVGSPVIAFSAVDADDLSGASGTVAR